MNLSGLSAVKNVKGIADTDCMLKMLCSKFHQFSPMKMHHLKSVSYSVTADYTISVPAYQLLL
jgi:hypothetical protein